MPFEPLPLNEETLRQLLNEATERPGLDYKGARATSMTRAPAKRDRYAVGVDLA